MPKPHQIIRFGDLQSIAAGVEELQRLATEGLAAFESLDGQSYSASTALVRPAQTVGVMDNLRGALVEVTLDGSATGALATDLHIQHNLGLDVRGTTAGAGGTTFLNVRWAEIGWQTSLATVATTTFGVAYAGGSVEPDWLDLQFFSSLTPTVNDPLVCTLWFHPLGDISDS